MGDEKLELLKNEAALFEQLLRTEVTPGQDALVALTELEYYFNKIRSMEKYSPIGRIRLDRLFIDGDLADNNKLADCYSRVAN